MSLAPILSVILLAPLVSALLTILFFRRKGKIAAILSVGAAGVVMLLSLHAVYISGIEELHVSREWLTLGRVSISMGFLFNQLSALMLFVVSFVGFWIHLFSAGYMRKDKARGRYFGGLSFFLFSMLGIVLADNLFMLFIFWELVGFSSYMLIGHYFEKNTAAEAAKKAFLVNRVGDFGFLIGIIWCYWQYGTVELAELKELLATNPGLLVTGMGLCLLCGVLGKSAQMPLHIWLPDAMEGPTPVSALIHAATMVAAGVYFLCRVFFMFTPEVLIVIAWVGAVTALFSAFCAIAQNDIKRILAFSTLSQLGFMVAVFGVGTLAGLEEPSHFGILAGVAAAMFHLTTHAFFKALLFLGSGSIIHACHHEQDIFKMGGLSRKMPLTFLFFTIGVIAISGLPWIGAGFWSKDPILYLTLKSNGAIYEILGFSAVLTALYMGRLWFIVFFGEAKSDSAKNAKESSFVMILPLAVLGLGSTFIGGMVQLYPPVVQSLLEHLPKAHGFDHTLMVLLSAGCSLLGLVGAMLYYKPGAAQDRLKKSLPRAFAFLKARLYFDEIYEWYIDKIQQSVAELLGFFDQLFISGLMVRGTAGITGLAGLMVRATHIGSLHGYVYWFFAGILLFWALAAGWL